MKASMNTFRLSTLTLIGAAALAACSSMPASNAALDSARSDYRAAQASTSTQTLAPAELKQAGDALALADAAFARNDDSARVDQLAYLARQRVALARETANRKDAEASVATASARRDKMLLASRTREADSATADATQANRDARMAQRQSDASQRDASAAQLQAAASQMQAGDAEARNRVLQAQLRDLNAKQTDRGMVITIGDVLFDSGQAQLKSGGAQGIQRLGTFLKANPQRKASIEGYTDSTGTDGGNLSLSARRADAVRAALLAQGVDSGQISAQGFGSSNPVAGNDNAGGRQMNRRVEIVLSDESGNAIKP
jgi:outer membrane protein OmpA-like peptidoglycan-associated protein